MASPYSKLKVAELKELLKERGISATGLKKQELIDALEQDDVESGNAPEDDEVEEEDDVAVATTKTTARSSTKRKASSPVPAPTSAKQPKKAKAEPPAADTPTDPVKPAPKITDAQFAPAGGANLDIPIDEGVSSSYRVYVDPVSYDHHD